MMYDWLLTRLNIREVIRKQEANYELESHPTAAIAHEDAIRVRIFLYIYP